MSPPAESHRVDLPFTLWYCPQPGGRQHADAPPPDPHPEQQGGDPVKVHITSSGGARDSHVYTEDGQELRFVKAATWRADADDPPTVELTVTCVPVDVHGEVTRWHGLDHVPTEALQAELDSRNTS